MLARCGTSVKAGGTIVAIGDEVALVSVGGKSEAQIDVAELKDADGNLEVAVGDPLQAVVVSTSTSAARLLPAARLPMMCGLLPPPPIVWSSIRRPGGLWVV